MQPRRIPILVAIVALALAAASCTSSAETDTPTPTDTSSPSSSTTDEVGPRDTAPEETTQPPTPITVWVGPDIAQAITEAGVRFEQLTGVAVDVETVDDETIERTMVDGFGAKSVPDIFALPHMWIDDLAESEDILPIDLGGHKTAFSQVALQAMRWHGVQFGVPYAVTSQALFYNTDLVDRVPGTIDELKTICDASTAETCLGIAGGGNETDVSHQYPIVTAFGAYLFGYDPLGGFDTDDLGIDSGSAIKGTALLERLVFEGYVDPIDAEAARDRFLAGTEAFWIAEPDEVAPLLASTVPWSVTELPSVDGSPLRPLVDAYGFAISTRSGNPDAAQTFLVEAIASPETMMDLHIADGRGSAYWDTIKRLKDDPAGEAFSRLADTGDFTPYVPEMEFIWDPLGGALLEVRRGELTATKAIPEAGSEIRDSLAQL